MGWLVGWLVGIKNITYLYIMGMDDKSQDLLSYFEVAHRFIDEALANKVGILVQWYCCTVSVLTLATLRRVSLTKRCLCAAASMYGESRSGTIVVSYLMQRFNWTYRRALEYARLARPRIRPKEHFARQLDMFQHCKHQYSHRDCVSLAAKFPVKALVRRLQRTSNRWKEYTFPKHAQLSRIYRWYLLLWKQPVFALYNYNFHFVLARVTSRSLMHHLQNRPATLSHSHINV
jgi:hypothetical protein